MDYFEVTAARGSYRGAFESTPVPEADLKKILSAGISAPSGYNHQTTSYLVVTDPALREQVAALMPTPATKTAPVMLIALSKAVQTVCGLCFEVEDYAASVENIMLGITALGYGGVWMDGMTRLQDNQEKISRIFQIPAEWTVRAVIPFGVPKDAVVQKEKQPLEARVFYNKFA